MVNAAERPCLNPEPAPLQGAVWSMKLNDPGLRAVTGSADFSARVWDALTGLELCQFPHKHIVRTVDFSHSSQRIVTGGELPHVSGLASLSYGYLKLVDGGSGFIGLRPTTLSRNP